MVTNITEVSLSSTKSIYNVKQVYIFIFIFVFPGKLMNTPSSLSEFIFHCVVYRDIMILWMLVIWMKMATCMSCLELMM